MFGGRVERFNPVTVAACELLYREDFRRRFHGWRPDVVQLAVDVVVDKLLAQGPDTTFDSGKASLETYLTRCVLHAIYENHRRELSRLNGFILRVFSDLAGKDERDCLIPWAVEKVPGSASAEDQFFAEDSGLTDHLWAIARTVLTKRQLDVMELYYSRDWRKVMTMRKVAGELKITEGAVKFRLIKGRKKLRALADFSF